MPRGRSSEGVSAACVDTSEEKQIRSWIWEFILKYVSNASLVKELTNALPFPKDIPRLKQMILINELSCQVSEELGVKKTLGLLEALQQACEDPNLDESDDASPPKRFKPSSSVANEDGSVWKVLRQPTLELREELGKLLSEGADVQDVTGIKSKLSALTEKAWTLLSPGFLEKTEAAFISGKYKPQGVSILLPFAENAGAVDDSGAKSTYEDLGKELPNAINERNEALQRDREAFVAGCAEFGTVVQDPLPALLRKPDSGTSGAARRNFLDPHPSAQARSWGEEGGIEESTSPTTPSGSKRVRLPSFCSPSRSPSRQQVASPLATPVFGMKLRRSKKKWSEDEVETLKREVQRYGKGRWKMILLQNKEAFQGRTEVDIKDKWRNLEKYGLV